MADYFIVNFHLAFNDAVPGEAFVDAFAGAGEHKIKLKYEINEIKT